MNKFSHLPVWLARLGFSLGGILLIAGLILSQVQSPVKAAGFTAPVLLEAPPITEEPMDPPTTEEPQDPPPTEEPQVTPTTEEPEETPSNTPTEVPACEIPENWDSTTRLFYTRQSSKEWHFEVDEPEMDVTLVFFYYQDYEKNGCPKDCATDRSCQTDEIGEGETPLGSFSISDGQKAPSDGKEKLHGRLPKGSYTASFHVTGRGSINIGMKVQMSSLPPTATPTAIPPSPTPTLTEVTPTSTGTAGTPTATPIITNEPPGDTPTATPATLTPTPTEEEDRPRKTATPAPPTLPPPNPPPGTAHAPALVPVTGGDSGTPSGPFAQQGVLLTIGFGLLGLGLIFHGISRRLKDL